MVPSLHFSASGEGLTVESARTALCLWLDARRRRTPFTVSPRQPEELRWLGLEGDREAEKGEAPDWLRSLPPVEECEPCPWGRWSGRTSLAELRELGVLPEAMVNFLALTAWQPSGQEEIFSREQLVELWTPDRLRPAPVRFDFELLRRVNRAWLQRADADRLVELSLLYFRRAGWLPEAELSPVVRQWLRDVIQAVLPGLDFLSLLPQRTRLVFDYRAETALSFPESREALEREGARDVLRAFGQRALEDNWLTVERFHRILEDLRRQTPWRGRNLLQPIQVLLTGLPFGPELDDLIPLFERGAEINLPVPIKSCRQRILEFCSVFV